MKSKFSLIMLLSIGVCMENNIDAIEYKAELPEQKINMEDDRDQPGQYEEGEYIEENPDDLFAQKLLDLGDGDAERSIIYYSDVLDLKNISNRLRAKAYISLGNAGDGGYRRVEHYQDALALTDIPDDLKAEALIGLGNARYGGRGNVEHYRAVLSLERVPKKLRAKALIGLGNALCDHKKNIEGLVYYRKAAKIRYKAVTARIIADSKQIFVENELKVIRERNLRLTEDERRAIDYFFPQLLAANRAPGQDMSDAGRNSGHPLKRDVDSRFGEGIYDRDTSSRTGQKRKTPSP